MSIAKKSMITLATVLVFSATSFAGNFVTGPMPARLAPPPPPPPAPVCIPVPIIGVVCFTP
jgi:hypothetical protein